MRHTPPAGAALALAAVKALVLLVVIAMAFGFIGGDVEGDDTAGRQGPAPQLQAGSAVSQAIRAHDCSVAGFDREVEPRSALVRRQGKVRQVSFDDGWAVFTGDRPGELIALCLDDY